MISPMAGLRSLNVIRLLLASTTSLRGRNRSSSAYTTFDRHYIDNHRSAIFESGDHEQTSYLRSLVGGRLADRALDIRRETFFGNILDLWCDVGHTAKHLPPCKNLILADVHQGMIDQCLEACDQQEEEKTAMLLPIGEELPNLPTSDLIVSNLTLQFINDPLRFLQHMYSSLNEDGTLIASCLMQGSLNELSYSLQAAECERTDAVWSHVGPMLSASDLIQLMEMAGFQLVSLDIDRIGVGFPSMADLMYDLKQMSLSNRSVDRPLSISRQVLLAAEAIYRAKFAKDEGRLPASFHVAYVIGWKIDPGKVRKVDRAKPQVSLKDMFK